MDCVIQSLPYMKLKFFPTNAVFGLLLFHADLFLEEAAGPGSGELPGTSSPDVRSARGSVPDDWGFLLAWIGEGRWTWVGRT